MTNITTLNTLPSAPLPKTLNPSIAPSKPTLAQSLKVWEIDVDVIWTSKSKIKTQR